MQGIYTKIYNVCRKFLFQKTTNNKVHGVYIVSAAFKKNTYENLLHYFCLNCDNT